MEHTTGCSINAGGPGNRQTGVPGCTMHSGRRTACAGGGANDNLFSASDCRNGISAHANIASRIVSYREHKVLNVT